MHVYTCNYINFFSLGLDNRTVSTCTPCDGDNVHLECPVNTSHWVKGNKTVCEDFNCTLNKVSSDDLGFYQCADYGLVLAVGKLE